MSKSKKIILAVALSMVMICAIFCCAWIDWNVSTEMWWKNPLLVTTGIVAFASGIAAFMLTLIVSSE